jgi:hypothetical protein
MAEIRLPGDQTIDTSEIAEVEFWDYAPFFRQPNCLVIRTTAGEALWFHDNQEDFVGRQIRDLPSGTFKTKLNPERDN